MTRNTFENNTAAYGNETASFPVKIMQVVNSTLQTVNQLENVPSGRSINSSLTFAIVDEDNKIMVSGMHLINF